MAKLETRVVRVAEATLAERRFVRPIDILIGLGWLAQPNVDRWERGRVPVLDRCVGVGADKVAAALASLQQWARDRGLKPTEADYQDLRFSDGNADAERTYRTHWASADISGPVIERSRRPREIVVISPHNAWACASCGDTGDFLTKARAGTLCMDCADLGHLEFLPAGDAALTRRAKKGSRLSAVVVRWSTRRKRYERQGILAEPAAIELAARACLSDADARARRRDRDQIRRADQDVHFRGEFAAAIREQFPGCPGDRAEAIALHAAARGSGRVGRSAAGRALDGDAVRLAVIASVRHVDTDYDDLLMSGVDRESARAQVQQRVEDVVDAWRDGVVALDD
ncbi:DUF2293 domain-containing protein [Mycolicibacterium tusciae]|uniref:DUF2293 domain-containing protein n=1 Tax=Mycolicibacterium tusciae TaxID=75922 RepID=UPI00024A368B|nr:DUF2293 domain-containing protein [Mycolicibacterium tusciae]